MNTTQWLYDILIKWITKDELIYFGGLATFLVAIITIYRNAAKDIFISVYEWISNIYTSFHSIKILKEKVDEIEKLVTNNTLLAQNISDGFSSIKTKVQFIENELSTNSGKSIKDLIDKIVIGIGSVEKLSYSLEYQVKKIEARQWNIMINNLTDPMFETDPNGLYTRANKAHLELVGLQMDDVLDNGWVNIILLEDRKLVQQEWESAIEDKRIFDLKYKIQNVNTNRYFMIRCVAQPVFVEKDIVGYIGRFLNVTEMIQDQKTNLWVKK